MPLTSKGTEILHNMEKTYGSEEKAKKVFYASKNAGKITGVDSADPIHSYMDSVRRGDAAEIKERRDKVVADRMKR